MGDEGGGGVVLICCLPWSFDDRPRLTCDTEQSGGGGHGWIQNVVILLLGAFVCGARQSTYLASYTCHFHEKK